MSVSVNLLDIPPAVKNALQRSDILTLKELEAAKLTQILEPSMHPHIEKLQQELERWRRMSDSLLKSLSAPSLDPFLIKSTASLSSLLALEDSVRARIPLFPTRPVQSPGSDKKLPFLNGIFRLGDVVEVCGDVATGKTQLAIQLSLCCQLGPALGGLGGEALFVDTEGGFDAVRASEMVIGLKEAMMAHLKEKGASEGLLKACEEDCDFEAMLGKIKYTRILDHKEQGCLIQHLEEVLATLKTVLVRQLCAIIDKTHCIRLVPGDVQGRI